MSKRTKLRGKTLAKARARGGALPKPKESWLIVYRGGSYDTVHGTFQQAQAIANESGKRLASITRAD